MQFAWAATAVVFLASLAVVGYYMTFAARLRKLLSEPATFAALGRPAFLVERSAANTVAFSSFLKSGQIASLGNSELSALGEKTLLLHRLSTISALLLLAVVAGLKYARAYG